MSTPSVPTCQARLGSAGTPVRGRKSPRPGAWGTTVAQLVDLKRRRRFLPHHHSL